MNISKEEYIKAKNIVIQYEKDNRQSSDEFPNNIQVGDTVGYILNGPSDSDRGKLKEFLVTEELLGYIKQYETSENYHQMRITKKG